VTGWLDTATISITSDVVMSVIVIGLLLIIRSIPHVVQVSSYRNLLP
jgi:hypothetical protein